MSLGAHIMLVCTGVVGIEGEWMLNLLEKAVDSSGARRVHSHVEDFDGSVSPLGFAAVVLLDESHVSAHTYSDRGWLAIDAFTCGDTDPARIIEVLEKVLLSGSVSVIDRNNQIAGTLDKEVLSRFIYS